MIAKVFPTNVALQLNKLSTRIREQFVVVSELECGAHAALADGAIDYWYFDETDSKCYLGELNAGSTAFEDATKVDVKLKRSEYFSIEKMNTV